MRSEPLTAKEVEAALLIVKTIGEAIREFTDLKGGVPSGELYANLMRSGLNLESYNTAIDVLKQARLIEEKNNFVKWIKE